MIDNYKLKPMIEDDWDQVLKLENEIFNDEQMTEDQFKCTMQNGKFLALEVNGRIIGELHVTRFGEDEAHLDRIGVAREHQKQGWGKIFMQYAIDWYKSEKNITTVLLYTQDHNVAAQSLYKLFGFKIIGTTWNYSVPYASIKSEGKYTCQAIREDEINHVGTRYSRLSTARIREILDEEKRDLVLTLKNNNGKIVGVTRFSPWFPGSFPFEIPSIDCFDDFIKGMEKLRLPEFDYVRIVFTDNEELAKVCEDRKYHLYHKLVRMSLHL